MNTHKNRSLGAFGEDVAKNYLINKGLVFVEQNFYAHGGEVDLIMKNPKDNSYVFIEVKTRRSEAFGFGEEAITRSKIRKIMMAVSAFFFKKLRLSEPPYFQIDALIVKLVERKVFCEHIEDIGEDIF